MRERTDEQLAEELESLLKRRCTLYRNWNDHYETYRAILDDIDGLDYDIDELETLMKERGMEDAIDELINQHQPEYL